MITPMPMQHSRDVSPEQYLAWIQEQLPKEMLRVLERRWFEEIDTRQHEFVHDGGDVAVESGFFRVNRIRHGSDRATNLHPSNMLNVLSSLRDSNHSLIYSVRSSGNDVSLRMGLRRFSGELYGLPTSEYVQILRRALRGNFPGIEMSSDPESYDDSYEAFLSPLTNSRKLACITGIPSLKGETAALFTQSVDRLVDALRGEEYTLLILAEPIFDVTAMEDRVRKIGGEIHTLIRQMVSESQGQSFTKTVTFNQANTITAGLGGVIGTLVGFSLGRTTGKAEGDAITGNQSISLSYEKVDKTAQYCEQMLDAFQVRLQRGRNLGFWNVGVFLASDDDYAFLRAQGILRGLYTGHQSYVEPLRMVELSGAPIVVREALNHLRIPRLQWAEEHPLGPAFYGLGTPLVTDEMTLMISLPHREVPGLKISPTADFNLNPPAVAGFRLGSLLYRGEDLETPVSVSATALTRHAFVTGLTGAGKTNSCLALLAEAYRNQGVNFLVIDPAKTEYRFLGYAEGVKDNLVVFTLGDESLGKFRLNPFEFEPGFPLLGHIDLVKAVFNAAFPMYASMPYLLEDAILTIYEERGWNVATSTNKFVKDYGSPADIAPYLPRLSDLHAKVDAIVSSKQYGAQLTQDLSAALKARLGSLSNGSKGLMLDTPQSTPMSMLLNRPVVLELRGIPDEDEKAFIMALLFIRLYEACRSRPLDKRLRHVTLIEEAHRLLRHVPMSTSSESANPRGKTVEMFADMMAEMRVYGEGFIIVDQMPSKLIPDVIKGSNLKIVHRLLDLEDREAVGNAMNLTSSQLDELPRLKLGQSVVHSEELEEACLVYVDSVEDKLIEQQPGDTPESKDQATKEMVRARMDEFYSQQRDLFRRHPACVVCDAPCLYQPTENAPTAELLAYGSRFLTSILLGEGNLFAVWRRLEQALVETMERRRGPHRLPGHDRCGRVLLANAVAVRFYEAHPLAQHWPAYLDLQIDLAKLWEHRTDHLIANAALQQEVKQWVSELGNMMRRLIAFAPATPKSGCAACPYPCLFGHRLQAVNNPAITPVLNRLRDSTVEQPPDWSLVQRVAVDHVGLKLSHKLQRAATYCLITQATTDSRLPRVVLRDMQKSSS